MLVLISLGFLGTLVLYMGRISRATKNAAIICTFFARILPNFSFCYGLMTTAT
jgi:hypothetical protein